MIQSIYASQFYKHSKRQKSIQAALADPTNQELVVQLAEALDEQYQDPEYLLDSDEQQELKDDLVDEHTIKEPSKDESEEKDSKNIPLEDEPKVSESANMKKLGGHVSKGVSKSELNDMESPKEPQPSSTETAPKSENKPVEESTQVEKKLEQKDILASTRAYFKDFQQLCDQIKGLLNLNSKTANVSRILVKENELQIFYDDSINLNDVMGEVIEILNAAGYTYLEFNRLMRSSNAIVFVINGKDTNNQVKPMSVVDEAVAND